MFNLFHLSLKLSGFPIEKTQADFEKILQISEADYPNYLETKKREIVESQGEFEIDWNGITNF